MLLRQPMRYLALAALVMAAGACGVGSPTAELSSGGSVISGSTVGSGTEERCPEEVKAAVADSIGIGDWKNDRVFAGPEPDGPAQQEVWPGDDISREIVRLVFVGEYSVFNAPPSPAVQLMPIPPGWSGDTVGREVVAYDSRDRCLRLLLVGGDGSKTQPRALMVPRNPAAGDQILLLSYDYNNAVSYGAALPILGTGCDSQGPSAILGPEALELLAEMGIDADLLPAVVDSAGFVASDPVPRRVDKVSGACTPEQATTKASALTQTPALTR